MTTLTLVSECYEALNKLAEDNQVTVLWTPEHRGIKGNETAYRLVKLATKQNPTGLEPVIGISNRSVTEDIKTEVFIGHGNLAYHRHKIGLAESPLCRLRGEDNHIRGESTHILYDCPAIRDKRQILTGYFSIDVAVIQTKSVAQVLALWHGLWG